MTILDRIVESKRWEVERAKAAVPLAELEATTADAPAVRDFAGALRGGPPIRLIAEVKKASPSKGVIREAFDPVEIAQTYQRCGAHALSVLTDQPFFQGHLDHLVRVRSQVELPVLRKDFIIDEYQVYQARAAGADAVLLIAECLARQQLKSLHALIGRLGMTALVEFHSADHLPAVLECNPALVGINSRDLHSFSCDLDQMIATRRSIPDSVLVVAESGIQSRADVLRLQEQRFDAMLVGETLLRESDISATVQSLLTG